jgi:hypothetical protein
MTADDAGTVPEAGSGPTLAVSAPRRRRWHLHLSRDGWRAWRRSRPFWGGLLLVLAGLELFAIPLSGVLIHGAIKLVIYIGIGGVFGVLIGVLLIVAGLMTWFNATHKTFYSIAGIVLGIVSFPASNLGGLFLGMLFAIIGGAIAFAWTPVEEAPEPASWSPVPEAPEQPETAALEPQTPQPAGLGQEPPESASLSPETSESAGESAGLGSEAPGSAGLGSEAPGSAGHRPEGSQPAGLGPESGAALA